MSFTLVENTTYVHVFVCMRACRCVCVCACVCVCCVLVKYIATLHDLTGTALYIFFKC